MNLKKFAFAAASISLIACNTQVKDQVNITPDAKDEVKIAYLLGSQAGLQLHNLSQNQLEFSIEEPTFFSAIGDGFKMANDSAFTLKHPDSVMQATANMMNDRSRALYAFKNFKPQKDSSDTIPVKAPEKPAPMTTEEQNKASYLLGVQFGTQFAAITKQSALDLDLSAFRQAIRDAQANVSDTTKKLQLSPDTLRVVGERFNHQLQEQRKQAIEKARKEEEAIKEKVANLRGDTLSDGTQAKMNFQVGVTGINLSAKNLEAYSGKPLFIFYFSTTCGHCRHATPEVKKIAESFKDKGIKTIAVASGGNNKRDIRGFIENFKLEEANIDVFFDEGREFGELYSDGYVPKAYIVKEDGSLNTFKNFESQKDSITATLSKLAK